MNISVVGQLYSIIAWLQPLFHFSVFFLTFSPLSKHSLCKTFATATIEAMRQLHVLMASLPEWSIVSYPTNNCWAQAFSLFSLALPLSFSKMLYFLVPCTCCNQNNDLPTASCRVLHKYSVSTQMVTKNVFFSCSMHKSVSYLEFLSFSLPSYL